MHKVPILPIHLECIDEPKVFLVGPSTVIFVVRRIVVLLLLCTIGIGMVLC